MGCQVSIPLGFHECTAETSSGSTMLEQYTIGDKLGSGAYGVVSRCRSLATGEELAVKIVDANVHPADKVLKEASIMKKLSHPNVVKFQGLFYERSYIYIVMDAYRGGDLVDGLQNMMKISEQADYTKVVHVVRQMATSVEYLHSRSIVHRDIKGDNFLMDRPDMTDPACHIALADFGAACCLPPGRRLHKIIGTVKFSAPELFDRNYGEKVDTWAVGVVTYGLVTGRFPFRNEHEVRKKQVRMIPEVDEVCQDLLFGLLEKQEDRRLSASEAAAHPWLRASMLEAELDEKLTACESESTTACETGSEEEESDRASGMPVPSEPEGSELGACPALGAVVPARSGSGEAILACFQGLARCRSLLPSARSGLPAVENGAPLLLCRDPKEAPAARLRQAWADPAPLERAAQRPSVTTV